MALIASDFGLTGCPPTGAAAQLPHLSDTAVVYIARLLCLCPGEAERDQRDGMYRG